MMATWSDDDSDDASEDMTANVVKALTVKIVDEKSNDGSESEGEEMSDEELAETYKLMYTKWKELCIICEKKKMVIHTLTTENSNLRSMSSCHGHEEVIQNLQKEKIKLQAEINELQEETSLLKSKLERLNKSFRLLNNGTEVSDHILEENKKKHSRRGIGFDYKAVNKESQKPKKEFVVSEDKEFVQDIKYQAPFKKARWVCHYCGKYGHLNPSYYRFPGYPEPTSKTTIPKVK